METHTPKNQGLSRIFYDQLSNNKKTTANGMRTVASRIVFLTYFYYLFSNNNIRLVVALSSSNNKNKNENNPINMMSLRQRLLYHGGKSYGPLLLSDSPVVAEMMAGFGYGHIVVDHEHSPTDVRSGQAMLQAIAAAGNHRRDGGTPRTEPIVRVASPNDPVAMKKVLDTLRLPGGVLVPMIEDAPMAEAVVRSVRYPQQKQQQEEHYKGGMRGCAAPFVRATGWGVDKAASDDYFRRCREDLLVVVQVETPQGVENIEEIAAVDGIDMIFLGPFDLSCSIGRTGNFDHPDVRELISLAEARVKRTSCLLGGFRSPQRSLEEMFSAGGGGYSLVCGAVDMGLLREAARQDLRAGNEAMSKTTTTPDAKK